MGPLVTIITPCYNGEEYLPCYFNAILSQTYDNIELIFVNDGSTDDTEKIALKYREELENRGICYRYLYQENGGQAKAINAGLKHVSGKYLVWPDADDIITPDSIEKKVAFLEAHSEYGFVRSNGFYFDYESKNQVRRISVKDNRFRDDIFLDLITEDTYCCCGCYMVRTCVLREIYPDMTIYESRGGQNWQILIPIAARERCGFIDEDLYYIAIRKDSHSRSKHTLQDKLAQYQAYEDILKDAVARSDRTDLNYQSIIEIKYLKLRHRLYHQFGDRRNAKMCYDKLSQMNAVDEYDYRLNLRYFKPFHYCFLRIKEYVLRD